MSGKTGKQLKHYPQRTCVGCHDVIPKRSLIRLVRQPQGVSIDLTGKASGRGAYLHNRRSCWENGLNGSLEHALKVSLTTEDTKRLRMYILTLPEEGKGESGNA